MSKKMTLHSLLDLESSNRALGNKEKIIYIAVFPDQKVYVGKTDRRLIERIREHQRHKDLVMEIEGSRVDWDKVKWGILDEYKDSIEMVKKERQWVSHYKSNKADFGFNQTEGGEGTSGFKNSPEQVEANSKRRKEYFKNSKNRKKQSLANKRAHALNPEQAKNHSKFTDQRFNGKDAERERKKTSDGMRTHYDADENRINKAFINGGRPFLVLHRGAAIGCFSIAAEAARVLGVSSAHISNILNNNGRETTKGYSFKHIGKGVMFKDL
jgi:hypothetical protein